MKKSSLCLIVLCICSLYSFSQSSIPFNVKIPLYGFRLDSISFRFTKAIDLREDKNKFATVYGGLANSKYSFRMKGGFQQTFTKKIFKMAFRLAKCGDFKVAVGVKKLFINEKEEDINVKKGRKRSFEIEVDYYLIDGEKMHFLYTDQKRIDTTIRPAKYFVNEFIYGFFEASIHKLDNYLSNPNEELAAILDTNVIEVEKPETDTTELDEVVNNLTQEKEDQKFTSLEETPAADPRILEEHLIGIERAAGTTALGLSFRYVYFSRKWDSLHWIPAYSLEIEATRLNREFENDPNVFDVYYAYFGVGMSAIKPLNNYIFIDLSAKIVFGRESIDHSLFDDRLTENFLIGLLLDQRLMFMLGKGFGLYLTAGVYENFMPTTKYLKTDFGFSLGGGLKF